MPRGVANKYLLISGEVQVRIDAQRYNGLSLFPEQNLDPH